MRQMPPIVDIDVADTFAAQKPDTLCVTHVDCFGVRGNSEDRLIGCGLQLGQLVSVETIETIAARKDYLSEMNTAVGEIAIREFPPSVAAILPECRLG